MVATCAGAAMEWNSTGITRALEMYTYFTEMIPARRAQGGDDVLSQILASPGLITSVGNAMRAVVEV